MSYYKLGIALIGVGLLGLSAPKEAGGAGFDNNNVGLRGISMGTAYHAIADDGSAIYYNPAGLALIDKGEMNVEAYALITFTKFLYQSTVQGADTTKNESTEMPVIPGGFISQSFSRWAVGLGVYVPYGGGGVVYKSFFPATGDTLEASAGFFGVSAAAAVEAVEHYLSIGVTPTIYLGTMENKLNPMDDPSFQTRVVSKNSGFAGVGATLGLMSEPLPDRLKVGVTVRSPVKVKMDGTITTTSPALPQPYKSDSTLEFLLPMEITLGVGATPIPKLTLGLTGSLIFHGLMDEIKTKTTMLSPTNGQEVSVTTKAKTYYKNNFRVAFGAEYMFLDQLGARVGVSFIQSPTEDKGLVPTSNDVNQLIPAVGLAWKFVRFLELDVTGLRVFGLERTRESRIPVPGQPEGTMVSLNEKFDADYWVVLAGLRFNWDFIPESSTAKSE